jgi:hypothetical protein
MPGDSGRHAALLPLFISTMPRIKRYLEDGKLDEGVRQFHAEIEAAAKRSEDEEVLAAYNQIKHVT